LGGGLDAPKTSQKKTDMLGSTVMSEPAKPIDLKSEAEKASDLQKELEKKQLDALMQDLKEAIAKSQALQPFKDQLLLDITPEGLRIQILDAQNRPMFDLGSSRLKPYTNDILREVTSYLRTVPNKISLTGHTDAAPYAGLTGFTNWDLSTDRANSARRSLERAGLPSEQISRVVGMGSSVLFDKDHPRDAVNRRISIVVMTRAAEDSVRSIDLPHPEEPAAVPGESAAPTADAVPATDALAPAVSGTAVAAAGTSH
jgi:chemotaxis protein MotB